MLKKTALTIAAASALVATVACGSDRPAESPTPSPTAAPSGTVTPTAVPVSFEVAFSNKQRIEAPVVAGPDLAALVTGDNAFALDLYRELAKKDGNLFMSPHSISVALAMTYAGARGQTESEMAETLHFTLSQEDLHRAMNALDQELESRGADVPADQKFTLDIANSIWGQRGFQFEQAFLDTLAESYGSGMRLVDYVDPATREAARQAINGWVEDNTNDRIKDLIPEGVLDDMTRLVLANAIYFKASWAQEFNEDLTAGADFHLASGGTASVEMMRRLGYFKYAEGDGYQAIEVPYAGDETSMVVLLPEDGTISSFESSLTGEKLGSIIAAMTNQYGTLGLPKFQFESKFSLPEQLKALGMEQAFDPIAADFTGISSQGQLVITDVIHQSFVSVDEQGTEAAAATAVIVSFTSAPVETFQLTADSPFIFLIRDIETGAVLFMGRFVGPEA